VVKVWRQVGEKVITALDEVTLAQISEHSSEPMFHI